MTPVTLKSLTDIADLGVDTIIDVRAPSEFAEDHVPGAINLPVLSDDERAQVGTVYAQVSPFDARKIGGAMVAQNTASHLRGPLAEKQGDWKPLIYCWRGGQRSGAFATILTQVGWRVSLLNGGYRSYRRLVVGMLYDTPLPHRITLIQGGTGTAKTRLLQHLKQAGAQMLDLEGLAQHRGSLFGAVAGGQPSQKMFESRLAAALNTFDPTKTTWIEAESSKVGARSVPPSLWTAMCAAPRIEIRAPLSARAAYLCRAYADLTEDRANLHAQIDRLRPYHVGDTIAQWQAYADAGDWQKLAENLIADHYDPRYARSAVRLQNDTQLIDLPDLEDETLAITAARLASEIK
ncbi:tRNA 2-selenouridine(34) synthase MnmH [Sulfitobacter sp. SK011]|uniref:tRNA 2-selenouridine(34) synthase MnmH n=1 Tax=Sulfitobacter sp. SK011 TaxID=1389004 RepID=UPI000E0B690D|nr:tRNA 2-selenouridine(34) synthase MnmH [Sulfitobacter sp. SK011]AXI43892.1 tRNA 2-selenouridine(34) synthase MnmH [Sulfitobacter sp. SK011]